ncbi:endonuclease/exonuclease/phosphatase family protein [Streptomyces niveus]|uniref:endonuclease/exonuclease/phosphatase family protein n=1 Tax=Streptomyces niveus TaxID=193462 RepID=UPI003420CFB1
MSRQLTVLCTNFENNGGGDPAKRQAMNERLVSLNPHLIFRQEVWDSGDNGNTIAHEAEDILGLRAWLGPQNCTALLADPNVFAPLRQWPQTGPMWVLPPTALLMRYTPAGRDSLPLALVSYHLNYGSPTTRQSEAEWLTTWNDKQWTNPDGIPVRVPALLGGDNNSYPVPGTPGDPPLPELDRIPNRPHRLHRSIVGPDGKRVMDTRPDEILRTAGLEDVARHLAQTKNDKTAVAPTVDACDTHGPDARIDRIYASTLLLAAVTQANVIDMTGLSDHHTLRVRLDSTTLTDLLNQPQPTPA